LSAQVTCSWVSLFITFRDQTRNQQLCLEGSRTSDLATVDLSAASDRMTCDVVGLIFRRNPHLLLGLQASRTRFVTQNLVSDLPTEIRLRKFSTMGSACTFPIQSIVFLTIVIASVLCQRNKSVTLRNICDLFGEVSVFGDDIIVPNDSRDLLYRALETMFFSVNTDKSFGIGYSASLVVSTPSVGLM
jgi:hypothetical protein